MERRHRVVNKIPETKQPLTYRSIWQRKKLLSKGVFPLTVTEYTHQMNSLHLLSSKPYMHRKEFDLWDLITICQKQK